MFIACKYRIVSRNEHKDHKLFALRMQCEINQNNKKQNPALCRVYTYK